MDVGAIGAGAAAPDPWAQAIAARQFAALGVGKGGLPKPPNGGTCFQCGGEHFVRDCPNGPTSGGGQGGGKAKGTGKVNHGGKGDKGKGKGKKGRAGWGICRDFQRLGYCPRLAMGQRCSYAHAKVPPALSGINNLVLEDLGEVEEADGIYTVKDVDKLDPAAILAQVGEELAAIRAEEAELDGPGFQGPP